MAEIWDGFRKEVMLVVNGVEMKSKTDLKDGTVRYFDDGRIEMSELPETNVIKYEFGDDEWLCIRPSGTEPKLKVYVSTKAESKEASQKRNLGIQQSLLQKIENQ